MIAIIDYGVGNLFSLQSSFSAIGEKAIVTSKTDDIKNAHRILLPGVGAFEDAANKLKDSGLAEVILNEVKKGKLILGICLGMQLLFEKSYEFGVHEGLGLLEGKVCPISDVISSDLKIPHIGWNSLDVVKKSPLFSQIKNHDHVYFVHSYHATDCRDSIIATAEYSAAITAAVGKGNVFGCQFHPEKSGKVGLDILKAFAVMKEEDLC